jgi:4a-hydroxytetrahydrobiopterin dehydratase
MKRKAGHMQKFDTKNSNAEAPSLLPSNKSREVLNSLDGWQSTDDHKMIYREFIFHDFMAAIDMIDHIAIIAEDEKHHPDLHLTKYRNLRVGLTTHEVGGLSGKDFAVASKINDLPFNKEHQRVETKTQPKKSKGTSVLAKENKLKGTKTKKTVNRIGPRIKKV